VITAAPAIHAHKQVGRDGVAKGLGLLPTGTGCTRSHLRVELTTTLQWGGSVDERRAGRVSTLVRTLELRGRGIGRRTYRLSMHHSGKGRAPSAPLMLIHNLP
jgi:hypothetical protein